MLHMDPLVPFGTGMVMETSERVCVQLYKERSAPLPSLGAGKMLKSIYEVLCIIIGCDVNDVVHMLVEDDGNK